MKKVFFFLISAALVFQSTAFAFTDTNHTPYSDAIDFLEEKGTIEGYTDGSYRPYEPINRAEFTKIVMESIGPNNGGRDCFHDIGTEWFAKYVCDAKNKGVVSGHPDGYFRPGENINLAEALKIVLEAYDIQPLENLHARWYENYFWVAKPNGYLEGINEDVSHFLTRGEMAQLIYNVEKEGGIDKPIESSEPIEPQAELNKDNCYLYDDENTYWHGEHDDLVDSDYDHVENRISESACEDWAQDMYPFVYDDPNKTEKCYLVEEDQSYVYSSEAPLDYMKTYDNIDIQACRNHAINYFNTDSPRSISVSKGSSIILSNNIRIEVHGIEISERGESAVLEVKHYVKTQSGAVKALNYGESTSRHRLYFDEGENWNESFGYRVSLISVNEDQSLYVEFEPVSAFINNESDLYRDCMVAKDPHLSDPKNSCYIYSNNEPIYNETEIFSNNFHLIGPKNAETFLREMSNQAEDCYERSKDYLQIEKPTQRTIIRVLVSDSNVQVNYSRGIRWSEDFPYNGFNEEGDGDGCENSTLDHEIVHAFMNDAPISTALNEGIATYMARVINLDADKSRKLTCYDSSYFTNGEESDFDQLNKFGQIPFNEGGFDLYFTAACFWDEFVKNEGYETFVDAIELLDVHRGSDDYGKTFDLFEEELSLDLAYYRDKYGFDYTGEDNEFSGSADRLSGGFGGSSQSRWDANYD